MIATTLAIALAATTSGGPEPTDRPTSAAPTHMSRAETVKAAEPFLKPGERVAHDGYVGAFGPATASTLIVVERGPADHYGAFAIVEQRKVRTRIDLPPFDSYAGAGITAIVFTSVDGDAVAEAVVLTQQMTGVGPNGAKPFAANYVFGWSGTAFTRLRVAEGHLKGISTSRAALHKVAAMGRLIPPTKAQLAPPRSATSFCEGRVYGKPPARHLSWEAFASKVGVAETAKVFLARLGSTNHEVSKGVHRFRFPKDKPTRVLAIHPAQHRGPWVTAACAAPAGSKAVIMVSNR